MKTYQFENLRIETTSICNSACEMCPREDFYDKRVTAMEADLFEKIVVDIHDNRIAQQVRFSGMGDASCDRKLLERLRFCQKRTPNLDIMILSNMAAWKPAYTDAIVAEKLVKHFRFSIFAVSPEESERAYGKPDQAEKARRAIEYCIKKNNAAGNPVHLSAYALLYEGNDVEVEKIKKVYWDAVEEFEIWKPHTWGNLMPKYRAVQKERRVCHRVENLEGTIRVNGDVCVCSMDINHNLVLGNMREQTFTEIYDGEPYRKLRELNRAGDLETIPTCKNCTFLNAEFEDALVESKAQWRKTV